MPNGILAPFAPFAPFAQANVYSILPRRRPGGVNFPDLYRVTVQLYRRLPAFVLGPSLHAGTAALPNAVRALLLASGYEVPRCRVVCDTAHASDPFDGETCSVLALPIAVAILRASGVLDPRIDLDHTIYFGQWSPGGLTWARPTYPLGATRDQLLAAIANVAVEHSMSLVVPEDCLEAMAPVARGFLSGVNTLRHVVERNAVYALPEKEGEK